MNLKKFLAENQPAGSEPVGAGKLEAKKDEILELHTRKFSLQQIVDYLATVDVKATRAGVSKLIKRETQIQDDASIGAKSSKKKSTTGE